VGYEEAGQLTEAVRRRPYAVVLFDEIEKAHPEVLNVMLQLLDDGRLTDGKGRTVDFKNSVVIMTSNIGSHFIAEQAEAGRLKPASTRAADSTGSRSGRLEPALDEDIRRQVTEALRAHFRPEFLNRVDEIIIFHALSRDEMRSIIDIQLRSLTKRLEDRKIRIELTDRAKDQLIAEGYDPTYGARPLKRTIQRQVLDPLAMRVLQGEFGEGDTVRIDSADGELRFEPPKQKTTVS
jgi:ATP-dependent Clp protease ATP-binding subunit ClpB